MKAINTVYHNLLQLDGAPVSAVNAVQRLTIESGTPAAGTFDFTVRGETATIPYSASAAVVQALLEALPAFGVGNIACTGDGLPGGHIDIECKGVCGGKPQALATTDSTNLDAGTATVANHISGVEGTYRGARTGTQLADFTNGKLYQNEGNAISPVWAQWDPSEV